MATSVCGIHIATVWSAVVVGYIFRVRLTLLGFFLVTVIFTELYRVSGHQMFTSDANDIDIKAKDH